MANLKSQGCTISKGDDASPQALSLIGQVISISGPDGSTGEIDVTNLSSTAKEFIPSLPDFGTTTLDVVFDHATASTLHADLFTDFSDQVTGYYQIALTDSPNTLISFSAFPNAFPISLAVDDKVGASIGLRITSTVTIGTATP